MSKITFYNGERKKYKRGIDYDFEKDYSTEIKKAEDAGDENLAAKLEDERNKKIDGENLPYRKTYNHVDIGTKIEKGIREGASPYEIKDLTDARRDKAVQNQKYDAFKSDEIQKRGKKYYYNASSGAGAEYENRPSYKNSYESDIKNLLSKISGQKEFSYNPEDDPVYLGLKRQMENESKKALSDTLAELSQYGGGANSYATSAASSAANSYRSKLSEKLPELYQMAYKRYSDNLDNQRKALDYNLKAESNERNRFLDDLSQFNKDRDFANKSYEADIEREDTENKRKYDAEQDLIDNEYRQNVFDYQKESDKKKAARELNLYYEKMGIPVSGNLLKNADMEDYAVANKESAAANKRLAQLSEIIKNRQIANYDARTAKTYSDMKNAALKTKISASKASAAKATKASSETKSSTEALNINEVFEADDIKNYEEGIAVLKSRKTVNETSDSGLYVSGEHYTYGALYTGICTGNIAVYQNKSGEYLYRKINN